MDYTINNRLEAFLSWISTGVKPEGWDLEPRNKEESFLAAKANRIDEIEQGGGPTPPSGPTDYNELINKPILTVGVEELVENEFYHKLPEQSYNALQIGDSVGIGDVLHIDTSKGAEVEAYLNALTFDPQTAPMLLMMATSRMNVMLAAADLSYLDPSAQGYAIMFQNGQDLHGFIYSTWAGTLHAQAGDVELTVGFQENFLDENGNITLVYSHDTISSFVEDALPELWNGIFIFKATVVPNIIGKCINNEIVPLKVGEALPNHVYKHNINFNYNSYDSSKTGSLTIYNNNATEMTANDIYTYLKSNSYYVNSNFYPGDNFYEFSNGKDNFFGIVAASNSTFTLISDSDGSITNYFIGTDSSTIIDSVETIL